MNIILLLSTSVLGFIQSVYIYQLIEYHFYFFCVVIGIVTSLANHGLTSTSLKFLDRFSMFVLFHYNLYLCVCFEHFLSLFCLLVAIFCFFSSKYCHHQNCKNYFHISSHICVSITNILISRQFSLM